jgi:hypothetical protein
MWRCQETQMKAAERNAESRHKVLVGPQVHVEATTRTITIILGHGQQAQARSPYAISHLCFVAFLLVASA